DLENLPHSSERQRRSPQCQAVALQLEEADLLGVDPVLDSRDLYVMNHLVTADGVPACVGQASVEGVGVLNGGRGDPIAGEPLPLAVRDDRPYSAITRVGDKTDG